jgi:hypothetical protein
MWAAFTKTATREAMTQTEAKRFFVDRVLEQARSEHVGLSKAERQMLSWSESDPDFAADPRLVEQLAAEISDSEYERKVAGLLERSYARDVAADRNARSRWREAYSVLSQGDHYLLVMIKQAVHRYLRPWWAFWS